MKKQLSGVQFSNLLQINWNQQKIQNNFKIIVDALSDHEKDKKQFKDDIESLKEEITFIKAFIKEGGTNITNHNVNVTREEKKGDNSDSSDPFKIREMIQKLQKQMKELGSKQSDTDMILDKIQDVQEKLKEEIKLSNQKIGQKQNINSKADVKKGEQNIRISPALTKKNVDNQKDKSRTSLKEINNSKSDKGKNQVNNENIADQVKSNAAINNQIQDLLQKIEELRSDNIKISAKLNSQQQAIETIRKAPAPSRLRSTEVKPQIDLTKIMPEKSEKPSSGAGGSHGDSQKNIRMQVEIQDMKDDLATLEDQVNKYYLDANTLRLCYEEMKLWINDLKKADSKKDGILNQINNRIAQIVENHKDDKDRIDQQLKQIRNTLLKSALEEKKQVKPQTPSISSSDRKNMQEFDENYKDKINDKLSKLQALLMQAATQSDLERVRVELKQSIQDTNNKVEVLKQGLTDVNKKLEENELDQQSQNSEIRKLQSDLAGLSGLVNDKFGAIEKKNNIINSKIEETKKNLQQIKEDLEFYKQNFNRPSSNIGNSTSGGSGENGLANYQGRNSTEFDKRKYEELKKQFLNKLHDNKAEMHSTLKDFERKFNNKNTFEQDIAILFDKIGEIKLFLGKKADAEDTKKSILYLEKKMSVAFASLSNEDDNTEDARVAKKNWFCLSCDKVLQNYNGKVGKHIVWDGLGTTKFGTKTTGLDENKRPKQLQPIKK